MTACLLGWGMCWAEPFLSGAGWLAQGRGGGNKHRWGRLLFRTQGQVLSWSGVFFAMCFLFLTENLMFDGNGLLHKKVRVACVESTNLLLNYISDNWKSFPKGSMGSSLGLP